LDSNGLHGFDVDLNSTAQLPMQEDLLQETVQNIAPAVARVSNLFYIGLWNAPVLRILDHSTLDSLLTL